MKKQVNKNLEHRQNYVKYMERGLSILHMKQVQIMERKDKQLNMQFPTIYKEHYQSSKSRSVTDVFSLALNNFGELHDIVQKEDE